MVAVALLGDPVLVREDVVEVELVEARELDPLVDLVAGVAQEVGLEVIPAVTREVVLVAAGEVETGTEEGGEELPQGRYLGAACYLFVKLSCFGLRKLVIA